MRLALLFFVISATAGGQWTLQESHSTASLRGVHSIGNGVVWASGSNGTVLRTVDSGKTWETCAVPPGGEKLDFRGVQGFDAKTAMVMSSGKGDLSRLYKTEDGCRTWSLLFTNPEAEGFWDAIAFRRFEGGRIDGWIFGDPVGGKFRVFHTDGAGFDADNTPSLAAAPEGAGGFAAGNAALSVLWDGPMVHLGLPLPPPQPGEERPANYGMAPMHIQRFVTGGKGGAWAYRRSPDWMYDVNVQVDWVSRQIPLGNKTEGSGAFAIAFRNADSGVIVGGDYTKPAESLRTAVYRDIKLEDWVAAETMPHGYRSAVDYSAVSKAWITVGPNGTDVSLDDGKNWKPLRPRAGEALDADQHWNALSLPFVVGSRGRIGILRADPLIKP